MASTTMMVSSATVARAASPAQSSMIPPFSGLKSLANLPFPRKSNTDLSHLPNNGCRVQCMKVWPIEGVKKFETLSYLPPLLVESLIKQIEFFLRSNWIPCLEFFI